MKSFSRCLLYSTYKLICGEISRSYSVHLFWRNRCTLLPKKNRARRNRLNPLLRIRLNVFSRYPIFKTLVRTRFDSPNSIVRYSTSYIMHILLYTVYEIESGIALGLNWRTIDGNNLNSSVIVDQFPLALRLKSVEM